MPRDEMGLGDERRERGEERRMVGRSLTRRQTAKQRERLEFVNLMGKSHKHQTYSNARGGETKKKNGTERGPDEICLCLCFMIRHVRLQIKSVISGLMNDLANYQRYLKTL